MKPLSTKHHFLLILLFAAFLMIPAFHYGATGIDIFTVARWAQYFSEELRSGILYPRWLPQLFAGYGSPVFFFYPPLPFYVTAIFYPLTHLDVFGFYPLACSALVGLMLAGVFCYLWLREETTPQVALLGTLLYMSAPPYLAQSFHALILIGQFWAFTWFALLLYMAHRLARGEKFSVVGFAVALALLILTNIPNFIFFAPIVTLYTLVLAKPSERVRTLIRLICSSLLAFGLAGIYLLPAFMYQRYTLVDVQWLLEGQSYAPRLFKLNPPPLQQDRVVFYSAALLLSAAAVIFPWWRTLKITRDFDTRQRVSFWVCVSMICLFLNLSISAFAWKYIPFLKMVQIPSRLFAVPGIALVLIGVHVMKLDRRIVRVGFSALLVVFVMTLWMNAARLHIGHDALMRDPDSAATKQYMTIYFKRFMLSIDQNFAYLPTENAVAKFFDLKRTDQFFKGNPRIEIRHGDADVEIKQWRGRFIELGIHAREESVIILRHFSFPGWIARRDGQITVLGKEIESGRLVLSVPASDKEQIITLELAPLPTELIGQLISILSALIALLYVMRELGMWGKGRGL